ncbi:hypothetical protein [Xanthobacter sediminis]|uniref:hypothetical protein n=3 Tax=Xanthobacter sediminis TaxID=3119926 RepID=UPI0037294607
MRLELRIPISPTPAFYSQVRLIALSLQRLGPPYAEAEIRVLVGDRALGAEVEAENAWSSRYPVRWDAVPAAVCDRLGLAAPGLSRYTAPSNADVVILCDADTCPIARFDELLDTMAGARAKVAGVQAHYSPFIPPCPMTWPELLDAIGQPAALCDRRYSLDVSGAHGLAPPYFNYGFVAFNAAAFGVIAPVYERYAGLALDKMPGSPFFAQIGLTLAMLDNGIEIISLGHEYNCANDDLVIEHNMVQLNYIKIIHYLRTGEFDRHNFLSQGEKYAAFTGGEKKNSISERLRRHVLAIPDAFVEWG